MSTDQTQNDSIKEVAHEVDNEAKVDNEAEGPHDAAGSDNAFASAEAPETPNAPKEKKKKRRSRKGASTELDATALVYKAELLPAPYYHYRNHSLEADEDPLKPVTQAGHVPCFPAKMHAILAAPDFQDIVAWDDHGRSFRILKPKNFESDILPLFFEHSKFSSYIRQANGWGFRRFLSGPNRGSYYQEYFLRSMPWLCKKMRRPKVGEKKSIGLDHEPDLRMISRDFPVPDLPMTREIQIVLETIKQGPRARMPVHWANEQLPPAHPVPAAATASNFNDGSVAAMLNNAQASAALANPYGMGAMTLPVAQSTAAAASANPQMLNYLQALSEQTKPAATVRSAEESAFAAGFRAASQLRNQALDSMLMGRPLHQPTGMLGASQLARPQANVDYLRLLQMQMAARGNMGAMGVASAAPSNARDNNNLTIEQLEAYQAGMLHPSMSHLSGGR